MLRPFAHPVPCYWMLLRVAAQSLKPVKLFSQTTPNIHLFRDRRSVAQQCWTRLHSSSNIILDPSAYGFRNAHVSSGKFCAGVSQNLAIWASQRMLFDPTKTFCFFYIFIAKVLCCFGIRTEEIQLTTLKNFQVSKVLAGSYRENTVKHSQSQIWDLKFAYAWQLIKYFCGLLQEAVSETRMAC